MSDPEMLRRNERYKMVAGGIFQLGLALFAAAAVKGYTDRAASLEIAGWAIGSALLMSMAWKLLGLLDSED